MTLDNMLGIYTTFRKIVCKGPIYIVSEGVIVGADPFLVAGLAWSPVVSRGLLWSPVARGLPWSPAARSLPWSPMVSRGLLFTLFRVFCRKGVI